MALIQRGLMILATAGALAIPAHLPVPVDGALGTPAKKGVQTQADFQPNQLEYYLGDGGIAYIRPGCNVKITGVTNVASGQKPVVEFYLTDDLGQPLDITGGLTPGVISYRFIPAVWNAAPRSYQNLIVSGGNPSRDATGKIDTLELGHYKYTFAAALPTFDATRPMTMFIGVRRQMTTIIGKDYWGWAFSDFVPSTGAATTAVWQATKLAKCNACHDPLALHGGNYRDIKTCAMCHNPLSMTGANVAFNGQAFWHSIHSSNSEAIGAITYPQDIRNCANCHDATAGGGDSWYSHPSRAACGACHTGVNFTTGIGHSGTNLPQLNDDECARCHQPQGDLEFDASVKGAHTVPAASKQLAGLKAVIDHVDNLAPGKSPVVYFKITNGDGSAVDGTKLARVGPMIGGPTTSYTNVGAQPTASYGGQPLRESAATSVKYDAATKLTSFTYVGKVPSDWKGSVGVSADIYRTVALKRGDGQADLSQREAAYNDVKYYSLDGSPVVERRTSVDIKLCNVCHAGLGLHGGSRQNTQECVICHNPKAAGTADPKESVSFQRMIHRIHTGELLSQSYVVASFNANEVTYPGDRRNCVKCHTSTGYLIPLPNGVDSVLTPSDYFSPQGPGTAACVGCHDLRDNLAHAYLNTAPFGEACASCHGAGLDYGVDKVHAR
jgi:OmcA/MtrC family decaheme c-type cytochrome